MTWKFTNSQLHCFLNSCVWAHMWCCTFLPKPDRSWVLLYEVYQEMQARQSKTINLPDIPALKTCPKSWYAAYSMSQQQDGAEFCAKILFQPRGPRWGQFAERRQNVQQVLHTLQCPISLNMPTQRDPAKPISVQDLIMDWHEEQLCLCALVGDPEVACLQVERNSGEACKNQQCLEMGDHSILMPTLSGGDMQVTWKPYTIVAATLHRGSSVERRHFQALLCHAGQTWLVDDGTRPRPHQVIQSDAADTHLM